MIAYIDKIEEIKFRHKIFNIIKTDSRAGRKTFLLPININDKQKRIEKITAKLCKILYEQNSNTVLLSNYLVENRKLKKTLQKNKIKIIDGKLLYNILLPEIIQTICNYKNSNIEEEKITIVVDENSEIILNNIFEISQKVKSVNIVTRYINKFNKISNYLYEELGILIRISNNIKKDLLNSNIIINVDFNEDLINKYYINTKAIIVNIPGNITIKSKKFAGININSYDIIIPEEYKVKNFEDRYIYEGMIYNKNEQEILKNIKKDNIKIRSLIGKNGTINKREFLSLKY